MFLLTKGSCLIGNEGAVHLAKKTLPKLLFLDIS
jgi:hypothetical protein